MGKFKEMKGRYRGNTGGKRERKGGNTSEIQGKCNGYTGKLDVVGPVDNRPSTE